MIQETSPQNIALVGIGNSLAGDDAAGITALEQLKLALCNNTSLVFLTLAGDLYEISDHLHRAHHFIFIDAVAGDEPGHILRSCWIPRAYAPSFHQTDIGAVMVSLERLECIQPFPTWELWGITIDPPHEIRTELSPPVVQAVADLVEKLTQHVTASLPGFKGT
ncbi:MAG: hypothetical protein A2X58_01795 [Nitrospirae bacterium GWC2_56_14]|nr:MAG: hypothetical protein A2X58_01795 [Nitrospirae bacterium GWC2_56_14]